MRIFVTVEQKGAKKVAVGLFRFCALIHQSQNPASLFLSPREFYGKFGKIPEGVNFELEIVDLSGIDLKLSHAHLSEKTGKPFVCYPLPIPTPELAQKLFEVWCLGAALTSVRQIDLNVLFSQKCGDDDVRFRRVVRKCYGLIIARSIQVP